MKAGHGLTGIFYMVEDLPAAASIVFADFCQAEAPRGAIQKANTKILFKCRDIFTNDGIGESSIPCDL